MGDHSTLYESMFEAATDGIAVHDVETGTVELANESYAKLVGRERADVVGATLTDLVEAVQYLEEPSVAESVEAASADTSQRRFCVPTAAEARGHQLELTLEGITVGDDRWLVSRLRDLGDIGGGFERMAVQITGLGVWQWDIGTGAVEWNAQFEQLLGMEPDSFEGTYEAFGRRVPDEELAALEDRIEESLETGELFSDEFRMRHEDGTYRWVHSRGQPVTTADGRQMVGTITDITDRRRHQEHAEELSSYLDIAMGGASPGIWEWNLETDDLRVNDRIEELLGMSHGAFEETFDAFVERVHPEDIESVQAAIQQATDNDELYETEFRIRHEDDGWIWLAARGELHQQEGTQHLVGVVNDVTDRKTYERELAASNEELEQLTAQLEFFTSILRHDVLNGMTVIKMRAEILAERLEGENAQYARTILEWANTTTEITDRVREVIATLTAPDEQRQFEPVDLTSILERKVSELRGAHPETHIETALTPGVWVQADELLGDAIGNIISNSLEHNDPDGLTVEVGLETDEDCARVTIEDDGRGIDDDRKEAIFRRGETSHAKESGSGFGLFYVDVMVGSYGGDIWVEDGDTGGARFVVELPLASGGGQA